MMREIDGRVYDTEKAEEVARRWNGWGGGEAEAVRERLEEREEL